MNNVIDIRGYSPRLAHDTTRSWIEGIGRKDGLISPSLVIRTATDSNHIRNSKRRLYDEPYARNNLQTKAIMNNVLPGMIVPGVLNWAVNESSAQVTSTASFECLNCLPLSHITTTVTNVNPTGGPKNDGIGNNQPHADTIHSSWAQDSYFTLEQVTGPGGRHSDGNTNVENVTDRFGVYFREGNVQYRIFKDQTFQVASVKELPDPAIPDDDDNDVKYDTSWARHVNGDGSYFILVGNEVMRTTQIDRGSRTIHVPSGGRAVNGIYEVHKPGEGVVLLGYGEPTGEYCAIGYLGLDDFSPETAVLRPGTCLVSYEGYGDIKAPLQHEYDPNRNYQFTGYWFVDSTETSLGDDGVPKLSVQCKGTGTMFEGQKINLDTIQRMKNKFGQWRVGGQTIFQAAGATRDIPGDWVDYDSWDSTRESSYPLTISVEYAQHKAFYDHMSDTQGGLTCIYCRQERSDYLKTHKLETARDRPVGKHIYKESIRVLRDENGGPIKTYIRLMATMAAAAWDHPAEGTQLAQKFSKIPNQLFDNIRNIFTGMCYNGQLDFKLAKSDPSFEWTAPGYNDEAIISSRKDLTCPFTIQYDNAPFSQPMLDLADINGATFCVSREGYPVFKPHGWNLRPEANGCRNLTSRAKPDKHGPRFHKKPHITQGYTGEWHLAYGASIAAYSSNVNREAITTQMEVVASTAFDIDSGGNAFTVWAAGTGHDANGNLIFYSPVGGNKQGLVYTGGVQQHDTMTLDNQVLGLDWNTNPANWGMVEDYSGKDVTMDTRPALYPGVPAIDIHTKGHKGGIKKIQHTINFFLVRGYTNAIVVGDRTYFTLDVDGKFTEVVRHGVQGVNSVLAGSSLGATYIGNTFSYGGHSNDGTAWGRASYLAAMKYFKTHKHAIESDIWWYFRNGKTWQEYVAAITGVHVPFQKGKAPKPRKSSTHYDQVANILYVISDKGMQKEVGNWYKNYTKSVINVGNRKVNETINQAVSRSVSTNLADPRIIPGDTIFCNIPGILGYEDKTGHMRPPFNNGIYALDVQRQMDLTQGTYTATYSGTRQQGTFGKGVTKIVNPKYDLITD